MPGPVSDSYDPVWGTADCAAEVRQGIAEVESELTKLLDYRPPRYILDVIRERDGVIRGCRFSQRQLRILRYACRVALEEEDI